jgi:uncharacterized membrane protein
LGLLSAFYFSSGVLHFAKPENYLKIMPPNFPAPALLIALSGIAECALAIGVLVPKTRKLAAWGIVALLVAVFPANVYMYTHSVETGGAAYDVATGILYWRLWLQAGFVLWAYWHSRPEPVGAYPL